MVKPKNIIARHHEKLLDFCGAGEDDGGRETDSPGGHHPIRTNGASTPKIPLIFTPDALPAAALPIFPGLGQAAIYTGLHPGGLGDGSKTAKIIKKVILPTITSPESQRDAEVSLERLKLETSNFVY